MIFLFRILAIVQCIVFMEQNYSIPLKVVGGVVELAAEIGVPVLVVAGEVFDDAHRRVEVVSLVERFGRDRALSDPLGCITEVVAERLTR